MRFTLLPNEALETRQRPARKARWDRYVPGAGLLVAGLLTVAAPGPLVGWLTGLGLTRFGALTVLASLGGALTVLAAKLAARPPVPTLVVGSLAISLGANLSQTRWMGLGLALFGLGWIGMLEAARGLDGIALTDRRVIMPRPMRTPLAFEHAELRAVHTTQDDQDQGALILESAHGTVTVKDLPGHVGLQDRIKARMEAVEVPPEPPAVAEARARIERLLDQGTAA